MTMPPRLTIVGDLERPDHYHLPVDAKCYFWGEYTPYDHTGGQLWNYSPTNQLIANFKKKKDREGLPEWRYKLIAVRQVAEQFAQSWNWAELHQHGVALIPIPPSKARNDPLFDPRMMQMLTQLAGQVRLPLDIRDCLSFSGVHAASHEAEARPTPDELYEALHFDPATDRPGQPPRIIFLFDDMLTSGAHYVAVTRKLAEVFPGVPVVGNFIARRIVPNPFADLEDLTNLDDLV
ncbi:hypothetical protein [Bordetella bronchiseptica]|uniref:hypothetical protein n=1 Tax=Bordetella bronchiseptica TaxID=518 RepID=UPI0002904488|nr:hypothetical protein [Bordetella bronchiseptica]KAK75229.1 hypothetical protein L530_0387 [Bordetella bronchiseptica MO211]CCN16708.1 putative uncharacterized protein [Bordetella bronchiseptica MO211]